MKHHCCQSLVMTSRVDSWLNPLKLWRFMTDIFRKKRMCSGQFCTNRWSLWYFVWFLFLCWAVKFDIPPVIRGCRVQSTRLWSCWWNSSFNRFLSHFYFPSTFEEKSSDKGGRAFSGDAVSILSAAAGLQPAVASAGIISVSRLSLEPKLVMQTEQWSATVWFKLHASPTGLKNVPACRNIPE